MAATLQPEHLVAKSISPQLPHSPYNEDLRLETLKTLGIAGESVSPDPMLNSMCKTITRLMDVPIAGVSIVQDKTLRMKAAEGLPADFTCARDGAFCSWTLLPKRPEMMVIEDTMEDARFASSDIVKGPDGLRFYAGAPLVASNGTRLGAVCIFDTKPRKMSAEELNLLSNFSEIASRRMEERDFKHIKAQEKEQLKRTEKDVSQPILLCDLTGSRYWNMLYCNEAFTAITGVTVNEGDEADSGFWRAFKPAGTKSKTLVQEGAEASIRAGEDFTVTVNRKRGGDSRAFRLTFKSARHVNLSGMGTSISVPNIVAAAELGDASQGYYFATVEPLEHLTAQRVSENKAAVQANEQHTFVNTELAEKYGYTAEGGMKDVTMGVLCTNNPEDLVYRARWKRRSVCVKVQEVKKSDCVCHKGFGSTPMPAEAALTLNLSHPNILATFKIVIEDSPDNPEAYESMSLVWMVREWCGKGRLSDALLRGWLRSKDGAPNMDAVLLVAREVVAAVAYLHSKDIIHGDICPDSVQLQEDKAHSGRKDFVTKLSEFGISMRSAGSVTPTRLGSAAHAAPELLAKGMMSKASDVYALGMLLWELYVGQAVWPSLNFSQLHRRVVAAKEKPALPAEAPPALKELIEACLANKAGARPSSAEVLAKVEGLLEAHAAGSLYAPLKPEQPATIASKLFRLESSKPAKESSSPAPAQGKAAADGGKPAAKPTEGKSLFKRFMPMKISS